MQRFRLQPEGKVATGFSGASRMSSPFVQLRPGFRALILQGAGAAQLGGGYILDETRSNPALRVAMPMGRADQNWEETITMSGALTDGARLRVFPFSGTHT